MIQVAFTGHRPPACGSYNGQDRLGLAVKRAIREKLEVLRPDRVITGCALGVDQWAAVIATDLGIPTIWAVPFVGFDARWPLESRAELRRIYKEALYRVPGTRHHIVCRPGYSAIKLQRRNEWMCDQLISKDDWLVAVHNGSCGGTENCIQYYLRSGQTGLINLWPRVLDILSQIKEGQP